MSTRKLTWLLAVLMTFALPVCAQEQSQTTIKHPPMKSTSPASGKEMFTTYCAVCHGTDGKGNGPAASALKTPPTDLTTLSRNNGEKYPSAKVASAIRGETYVPAHGSKEMPVWGQLFWNISGGNQGQVLMRVTNLTKYVETLQQK